MREKLIEVFCSVLGAAPDFQDEEAIKFVDELIANGVTIQEWIPVTERLPAKYKEVLVYRLTGCEVDCCIDTKNRKWVGDEICCYDVTHWMPLPEPPKGE